MRQVLIDDVVSLSEPQLRDLKHAVSVAQHHSSIYVLVIVFHTIHGSGMSFLLSHADTIFLTANRNSSFSLRSIWSHYKLPTDQLQGNLDLLSTNEPFTYLKISPDSGQTELFKLNNPDGSGDQRRPGKSAPDAKQGPMGKSNDKSPAARRARLMKRGSHFSAMMPDPKAADEILNFIMPVLPPATVEDSLVVNFESKKNGQSFSINILDYIYFCLTPDARPSSYAVKFHKYIRRCKVHIPVFLIKNKYLKKISGQ